MKPQSVKRTAEPQRLLDERVVSRPLHGLSRYNALAPSAKALGYSHSVRCADVRRRLLQQRHLEQIKKAKLAMLRFSRRNAEGVKNRKNTTLAPASAKAEGRRFESC
jgi:hypothetical protein